jgi:phosphatidylserine decarboxylase
MPESEKGTVFRERPTAIVAPEGWPFLLAGALATLLALAWAPPWVGLGLAGLTAFVLAFFRNPERRAEGDECCVFAPADGRVLAVDEIEDEAGRKGLRIGIFLSVFDVHVNRAPVAGRVVALERGGTRYLAAFDPRGERENVRLAMTLESARGERVVVTQITGLVARRIVCHPRIGEWLARGVRYGLIRFGSRTDVLLPPGSRALVSRGDRAVGGRTCIARLPEDPAAPSPRVPREEAP